MPDDAPDCLNELVDHHNLVGIDVSPAAANGATANGATANGSRTSRERRTSPDRRLSSDRRLTRDRRLTADRRRSLERRLTMERRLVAELRRVGVERDTLQHRADGHAAQIAAVEHRKEEFILAASHDLMTPLTSIHGFAQLCLRQLAEPEPDHAALKRGVEAIDAKCRAMTSLIGNLLDAARIQAGLFESSPAPCLFVDCLAGVLAHLSPDERARIDLVLPDAPLTGEWEQEQIEQVLANLIGNALKYSEAPERVCVTVENRTGELEVAISDHGLGLPSEELGHLFVRFYRTPQARASGLPGTGLGLYICRGIIAAHNGRLWAESKGAGKGTTFRFTLPSSASLDAPQRRPTSEP
ncbi:MAG: HAMP domain-containing histidine kinase [Chloroflexi bacterium]|nr:HAMP domain-containing histidine kinase [Chloroflexota bacterium]